MSIIQPSRRTPSRRMFKLALIAAVLALMVGPAGHSRAADSMSIAEFTVPTANTGPLAITAGPDGNVWFVENLANSIGRITPEGAITEFNIPTANANLADVTAGPDNNLWFTEPNSRKIGRITPTGQVTEFPLAGSVGSPSAITSGPDGLWFTIPLSNTVGRITTAGVVSTFVITTTNAALGDIAAAPDGTIWVTESATTANAIARLNPETSVVTEYPVPTEFARPAQLVVVDSKVYFTETLANQIGRLDSMSGQIQEFPIPTDEHDAQPIGITADQDGNVYFAEAADGAPGLGRLAPDGTIVEFITPTANASVRDVTIGPDGNLWYAAFTANKIGRGQIGASSPLATVYLPLIRR